jgi:hypothetical protein
MLLFFRLPLRTIERENRCFFTQSAEEINQVIKSETSSLLPEQKYIRGLFSGGTFCYEAQLLLRDMIGKVYSNTPLSPDLKIAHHTRSQAHTLLDLGSDEYTVGRPHPMIDFRTRLDFIEHETDQVDVAVILLDVVLGYGSHADPASELAPAVLAAREKNANWKKDHFCGIDMRHQCRFSETPGSGSTLGRCGHYFDGQQCPGCPPGGINCYTRCCCIGAMKNESNQPPF